MTKSKNLANPMKYSVRCLKYCKHIPIQFVPEPPGMEEDYSRALPGTATSLPVNLSAANGGTRRAGEGNNSV